LPSAGANSNHSDTAASLTIPTGGAGIGYVVSAGTGGVARTWSWTNLSEDTDATIEGAFTHSSALSTSAGSATRSVTASGGIDNSVLLLAAWGP
jgi:hypothetical protein